MFEMRTRIAEGRLQYIKSIDVRKKQLLKRLLENIRETDNDKIY